MNCTGCVVATVLWWVTNQYMLRETCSDQDVEWAYCFDVHLNAYFPPLIILHFIQLFFFHALLSGPSFLATLVGNVLWLLAIGYYIYITFLGYNCLAILRYTKRILFAFPILGFLFLVSLCLNWNLCAILVHFYQYRVL